MKITHKTASEDFSCEQMHIGQIGILSQGLLDGFNNDCASKGDLVIRACNELVFPRTGTWVSKFEMSKYRYVKIKPGDVITIEF